MLSFDLVTVLVYQFQLSCFFPFFESGVVFFCILKEAGASNLTLVERVGLLVPFVPGASSE